MADPTPFQILISNRVETSRNKLNSLLADSTPSESKLLCRNEWWLDLDLVSIVCYSLSDFFKRCQIRQLLADPTPSGNKLFVESGHESSPNIFSSQGYRIRQLLADPTPLQILIGSQVE